MNDAPLDVATLVAVYSANYRDRIPFDDFTTVAGHTTGTVGDRLDQLHAWLRPAGYRPLREAAIARALTSTRRAGLGRYVPDGRVVASDTMPAAATATRPDGRLELHLGEVEVPPDIPVYVNHDTSRRVGKLVGYEHGRRGTGSLTVWFELLGGAACDDLLVDVDYGRFGTSVGVFHDPKHDDGGGVLTLSRQRLAEVSLVPLGRAGLGEGTLARREAVPEHLRAAYQRLGDRRTATPPPTAPRARPAVSPVYLRDDGEVRSGPTWPTWQDGKRVR